MTVSDEGRRLEEEMMAKVFVLDAMRDSEGITRDVELAGRVYVFEATVKIVEEVDEVLK